jgi:hypothetical protein
VIILLKIGDKIYYIDYEESKHSYTIIEVIGEKLYYIHSDHLPNTTGYYTIPVNIIDSDNIRDRFFSSPKLAHIGYSRF